MFFNRSTAAALLLVASLPLAGCPIATPMPYYPEPPYGQPEPAPLFDGPGLDEAHREAEKWLDRHYPARTLLAVEGAQIDSLGRSGQTGWTFTYRVSGLSPLPLPFPSPKPVPSPSPKQTPSPKFVLEPGEPDGPPPVANYAVLVTADEPDIMPEPRPRPSAKPDQTTILPYPLPVPEEYLAITVDGRGRVLAPEPVEPDASQAPIDLRRTVALRRLLYAAEDMGARPGPAGVRVLLSFDARHGATYELDPQFATREAPPMRLSRSGSGASPNREGTYAVMCAALPPQPYRGGDSGVLYRGSYLFDAYTGALISRPERLQ